MPFPLSYAQRIAAKVVAELAVFCDQIEIAGSIRRRRPVVGDIDIVLLPKPGLDAAIRERSSQRCRVIKDGPQNLVLALPLPSSTPIQLDLWFAHPTRSDLLETTPGNFGSLLLCRTGSVQHNIRLIERAKGMGLRWNPHHGVFDGDETCLASETEESILRALGLGWIPPETRDP